MKRLSNVPAHTWSAVALLILICHVMPTAGLQAQPNLTFKRVTVNWPTIELYVTVGCDGNPAYNMSKQDFRIYENGVEVKDFTVWCPDPTKPCAKSVALVFDASGSMIGSGNAGAKLAGHAFIDLMDGVMDEAAVIWFTSVVTVQQQMTTNKQWLHAAVDALPAGGLTAVWDGGYFGLLELINNGVNQCRAVILLTDGGDGGSTRTPAEIIALANRHRINVFTVALGSSVNAVELQMIASLTGGKYYQTPNAGQLAAIYQEIFTIIRQSFQECIITYERECADGALRTVDLQLKDFCGGSDTKTKTYRAPLDSSTFKNLNLEIGDATGKSGADITLPLNLISPINGEMFYPLQFTLEYDTSCVQLKGVSTPTGSLLEGAPIMVTPHPAGALIQVTARKLVHGGGLLLNMTFKAANRSDTACCDIRAAYPRFEQGCFIPVIETGSICINAKAPQAFCDINGTKRLQWDRKLRDYQPNPFIVTGRCDNIGDTTLRNARCTIIVDTHDVRLVSPVSTTQLVSPADIAPGMFAEVNWQLAAKKRTQGDSIEICIRSSFDNYPDVICCHKVFIPQAGPMLECTLDAPAITADTTYLRYNPMPFPVTVTARNTGGSRTDTLRASIVLPTELTLAAPDAPDRFTKRILPSLLNPGQEGSAEWMLQHAPTTGEKHYTVTVWCFASNTDSSKCEIPIRIPGLPEASFRFELAYDDSLRFCSGDSVTLDAGAGYASYAWSSGAKNRMLVVRTSGQYFCTVRRTDGALGISDTVHVSVHNSPQPVITPGGPVAICKGETVHLWTDKSYPAYEWSTGASTESIVVTAAGRYSVRVRNELGCWGASDTTDVIMKPAPAKPVIRRLGDALRSDTAHAYQWYLNSTAIPGATGPLHVARQTGVYQVQVTNAEGCSALSDPFNVTVLDVDATPPVAERASLHVWPEPATDLLRIALTGTRNLTVTLALYDVLGRADVIHTGVLPDGAADFTHSLHARGAGVYYLVAMFGETVLVKRVTRL
ncbi:MAG: VWA domain-containing protein [Bacteroidia bacterium]|nr:VWA domain-containing protein [Bacteroidia bacterium]